MGKSPFSHQSRELRVLQAVVFLGEEERKYIALLYLRKYISLLYPSARERERRMEREKEGPEAQVSPPQDAPADSLTHLSSPANGA